MKKIFYALVAIFALGACIKEDLPVTGGNATNSEGGYVEVGFSVVLPDMKEATRAMDAPAIERLHLLVFDDQGVLADAVPATAVNGWGVSTTATTFKAKLARTGHKRTIHLVANSPIADVDEYHMSTESSIIAAMEVSDGKDAYWQRIEFPDGIYDDGKPINVKDENGNEIPTYYPHQDIIDKLTAVPLVRNYSRVKVVNAIPSSSTQLYNVEFVLVNIPEKGSVAPFNTNKGEFQAINASSTYDTLLADSYNGYEPTGRELINNTFNGGELICEDYTDWVTATADVNSGYHYLYERNQNIDPKKPAYILVKGSYANASATPTYYKVAIINGKGVSYNLLRNIQYTVSINGVLGEGFKTAKEAYEAGPSNNLNFSVETKNLLNLSDGTRTIYVEYTQKVINTANTVVTLRYKYDDTSVTNADERAQLSDTVVISVGDGKVISGDVNEGEDTTDSDGWNTLSFTTASLPAVGESAKTQIVTLTAGSFARNVEFILTRPYTLKLDVPDMVGDKLGSSVISSLILEERLPMGIFPLEFVVVAENNSLSPDATLNTLPVVTNVNLYGQPGGNYFGYKVTLDYEDYCTVSGETTTYKTTIPLYFKTNMAQSSPLYTEKSTVEGIDCYAYNQYHSIANDEYWIHKLYGLSLSVSNFTESTATTSFLLNTSNQTVTWPDSGYFDFDILSDHTLTGVTDRNGVAVSGASIVNSGKTLRITQAAYNAARNYTLTLSAPNITGTTMTISNAEFGMASATVERYAVSWSIVGNNNNNNQTTMSSGTEYRLRIVLPAGISNAVINTLKIKATTTRTTLLLNNQTINSGSTETIDITSSMYNSSTGYIYVPITATTAANNNTRSFTLTLEGGDMFELPGTMTRTYSSSWGSYGYR